MDQQLPKTPPATTTTVNFRQLDYIKELGQWYLNNYFKQNQLVMYYENDSIFGILRYRWYGRVTAIIPDESALRVRRSTDDTLVKMDAFLLQLHKIDAYYCEFSKSFEPREWMGQVSGCLVSLTHDSIMDRGLRTGEWIFALNALRNLHMLAFAKIPSTRDLLQRVKTKYLEI